MNALRREFLVGTAASLLIAVSVAISGLATPSVAIAGETVAANPCAAKNPCAPNPCAFKNPCAPAAAAELTDAAAAAAYQGIKKALRAGYAKSGHPVATAYFQWRRYNKTPYVSETHGGRFVNNYANEVAKAYGKFEKAGVMPVGSVLAKDSFLMAGAAQPCAAQPCAAQPCAAQPCAAQPCAAQPCAAQPCAAQPCAAQPCAGQAAVQPGPLFIMEKMEAGFSPGTDDWRYSMIMPNGAIYGVTGRPNAAKVDFCAECHGSISEEQDSLFFLPEEYR